MASVSVCVVCVFNIHSANIYYSCLFCGEYYASVGAWEKEENQRSALLGSFSYPLVEELCRQALVLLGTSCLCACVCLCSFLCSSVHILVDMLIWSSPKPPFQPVLISFLWLWQNTLTKNNPGKESDVWVSNSRTQSITEGSRGKTGTWQQASLLFHTATPLTRELTSLKGTSGTVGNDACWPANRFMSD